MSRFVIMLVLFSLLLGIVDGVSAQDPSDNEVISRKFVEAQRARQTGRNDEAIVIYRELAEAYPDRQDVANSLGRTLVEAGMFEEAVEFLTAARVKWPDHYRFTEFLGQAYLELGQREKAVEVWHSVLTGQEKDVSRYLQVSRAEWNAGMYDQAIATLKEGRKFPRHYARFTAEIVRMERTRGNHRGAFLESLPGYEMEDMPDIGRAAMTIRAFREAGRPADLIAVVDSFTVHGKKNKPFFETLEAALLVEVDDYAAADGYLLRARSDKIPERDLYSFILYLYTFGSKAGDPEFEDYLEKVSSGFIIRFPDSPRTPRVLLEGAEHAELAARRGGPREREYGARSVAMADSAMRHKRGRPYTEKASLLKARVQLDHLRDAEAAIKTVDSGQWRHVDVAREAAAIRLEALVMSGRWDDAMKRFEALAASPDSSLAASGKYGKGMVLFYRGDFDSAGTVLSEVAKEAPWSKWANDALATAVLVKRAEEEDPAVLASFAAAMAADGSGKYSEAADSLAAAAGRAPRSVLAPEAFYESALLLERAGRRAESIAMLERIAETYPLSRAAPRAVETLAAIEEEDDPQAAVRWYALFLERYGEDPWATRVRSRYMRLRKSMEGEEETDET